jgi:hypothetical protein
LKRPKARKAGRSGRWLRILVIAVIAVAVPGLALLAAVLLCPVGAFYALAGRTNRAVVRPMLLASLGASAGVLRQFWDGGLTLPTAFDLLADPARALAAWAACAGAWLICELATVAARLALAARVRQQVAALRREQEELREEWVTDKAA